MFHTPTTLSQTIMCQVQLRCFRHAWLSISFSFQEFGSKSDNVRARTCRAETWSEFDRWNMPGYPRPDERKTSRQEPWNLWEIHAARHMCSHVHTYHTFWQRSARGMPKKWLFEHPDIYFEGCATACTENRVLGKEETSRNDGERPDRWSLRRMKIETNDKSVHRC